MCYCVIFAVFHIAWVKQIGTRASLSLLQKQGGRKGKRRSKYFCWQKLKTATEHPKSFSLNNILMCLFTAESRCTIATHVCIHKITHIHLYGISRLGLLMKIVSVSLHSTEIVNDRIYDFHPLSTCIYTAMPNSPNTINLTQGMNWLRPGEEPGLILASLGTPPPSDPHGISQLTRCSQCKENTSLICYGLFMIGELNNTYWKHFIEQAQCCRQTGILGSSMFLSFYST